MEAATSSVQSENMTIREASKVYNVSFETLRRHVNGTVIPGCRSGPATILNEQEEERLASYLIPYSGFYLRGPNFCKICEVLTSSQILILKLLFYFREPATEHIILAPGYHI